MCLNVKNKWHKDGKPLIAEEDFVVFKVLYHSVFVDVILTPVRQCPIIFTNGKAILKAKLHMFTGYNYAFKKCITVCTRGIHAFLNSKSQRMILWGHNSRKLHAHKAIIPKGTKYYIGEEGDIVAEKMIILEKTYNA